MRNAVPGLADKTKTTLLLGEAWSFSRIGWVISEPDNGSIRSDRVSVFPSSSDYSVQFPREIRDAFSENFRNDGHFHFMKQSFIHNGLNQLAAANNP